MLNKIIEKIITKKGIIPLAISASKRLDKKYIKKININEYIIVEINLSFCFKLLIIDEENKTKEAIKIGRNAKL